MDELVLDLRLQEEAGVLVARAIVEGAGGGERTFMVVHLTGRTVNGEKVRVNVVASVQTQTAAAFLAEHT